MLKTRRFHAMTLGIGLTGLGALLVTTTPAHAQSELATLTAGDAAAGDQFGSSVAVSGNYAIVGAPFRDGPGSNAGAVYFFELIGGAWTPMGGAMQPGEVLGDDRFGASVAIDGDVAVVGAPQHDAGTADGGAVWVYRLTGGSWVEEQKIVGAGRLINDRFGDAVAVEGDRIVVGASQNGASGGGRAYVYDYSGGSWTHTTILTASSPAAGDDFGLSVDLSGTSVIVGARGDDASRGAAYVFVDNGGGSWSPPTTLVAPVRSTGDQFGSGVAISGNTAAIGAPGFPAGAGFAGAVYAFDRSAGAWGAATQLGLFEARGNDSLGFSVAMDGNRITAGAPTWGFGDGADNDPGAAAIYQRIGGVWDEDSASPTNGFFTGGTDHVGTAVSISGDIVFAGSPGDDFVDSEAGSVIVIQAEPVVGDPDTDGDGLTDAMETALQALCGCACPSISDADSDDDGLSDGVEVNLYDINPCNPDSDGDGLNDAAEISAGTDPQLMDTDTDGLIDGMEGSFGTNPLIPDTDGDGMLDGAEVTAAAGSGCPNPLVADSDGDGFSDGDESTNGWNPCNADTDGDTLSDFAEVNTHSTDPNDPDTDDDNMGDGAEVALAAGGPCPDPNNPDSDGDLIPDGDEVVGTCGPCDADDDNDGLCFLGETAAGTNPNNPDTDGDGLLDGAEVASGCTNPLAADSDGDTLLDGAEATAGTNPCNADTDGDTLPDNSDPNPLQFSATVLAALTLATAGEVLDTPAGEFLGPNANVRTVRRTILVAHIALAAAAIDNGNYNAAQALLTLALSRVDGLSPPPDWMADGSDKTQIRTDLQNLLVILDLIN